MGFLDGFPSVTGNWDLQVIAGSHKGVAGAVAFGGFEEESLLGAGGQSGEAGFAVELVPISRSSLGVHESVGDVDFDFGGVDGCAAGSVMVKSAEQDPMPPSMTGRGFRVGGSRGL